MGLAGGGLQINLSIFQLNSSSKVDFEITIYFLHVNNTCLTKQFLTGTLKISGYIQRFYVLENSWR